MQVDFRIAGSFSDKLGDVGAWIGSRAAHEISLNFIASKLADQVELVLPFDSFDNHTHPNVVGKSN